MESTLQDIRILIVDDTPQNLALLKDSLEDSDVIIDLANSGEEALKKLNEYHYALILLDICMPDMDGYEIAKQLKKIPKNELTPFMFVTAIYKDEDSILKAYKYGAVDYIFKPINPYIIKTKSRIFINLEKEKYTSVTKKAS